MKKFKGEIILFATALIWGLAFIFQSEATNYIGPFTFNAMRFLLGAISILPLWHFNRSNLNKNKCIKVGILLGVCIGIGANLQQYSIAFTSAAKTGFVTSLYMILVPFLAFIMYRRKISKFTFLAIIVAFFGLYLLCDIQNFTIQITDILLIITAIFFALQIIFIGEYANDVNSVLLSLVQYFTAGFISLILALIFEDINIPNILNASSAILYTGILSTGVAYTIQIIGQRYTNPTVASLILSLESVIAAIGGYFILHEVLSIREVIGCILMFIAVILAQIKKGRKS